MGIEATIDTPLAKVVRAVGNQSKTGRLIGKTQATVHEALRKRKPIWPEAVLIFERETGIPRGEQRPDIYPPNERPTRRRARTTAPAEVGAPLAGTSPPIAANDPPPERAMTDRCA